MGNLGKPQSGSGCTNQLSDNGTIFNLTANYVYMGKTVGLANCQGALCVENRHRLKTGTAGIPSASQN